MGVHACPPRSDGFRRVLKDRILAKLSFFADSLPQRDL